VSVRTRREKAADRRCDWHQGRIAAAQAAGRPEALLRAALDWLIAELRITPDSASDVAAVVERRALQLNERSRA